MDILCKEAINNQHIQLELKTVLDGNYYRLISKY